MAFFLFKKKKKKKEEKKGKIMYIPPFLHKRENEGSLLWLWLR